MNLDLRKLKFFWLPVIHQETQEKSTYKKIVKAKMYNKQTLGYARTVKERKKSIGAYRYVQWNILQENKILSKVLHRYVQTIVWNARSMYFQWFDSWNKFKNVHTSIISSSPPLNKNIKNKIKEKKKLDTHIFTHTSVPSSITWKCWQTERFHYLTFIFIMWDTQIDGESGVRGGVGGGWG